MGTHTFSRTVPSRKSAWLEKVCVPFLVLSLAGCEPPASGYSGYVEGETVRVAAPVAGQLTQLAVARGAVAKVGDPLFTLEQQREAASVSEASQSISAVKAQIEQAAAQVKLASANFERLLALHKRQGLASQEDLDRARTTLEAARAKLRELEAQQRGAQAQLSQRQWQLTQKTVTAPASGLVEDTYYRVGEWVPSGAPVLSLLPPENRVVRFFVPESVAGGVKPGQGVKVTCDGCPASLAAAVTYVSPQAEYTPPVIYSRENREKLVFLVEARAQGDAALGLRPGQPVHVELDGR